MPDPARKQFHDPQLTVYGRQPPQHARHLVPPVPAPEVARPTPAVVPEPAELARQARAMR